jgi:hypothetical protein
VRSSSRAKGTTAVPLDSAARGSGRTRAPARGTAVAPPPPPSGARAVVIRFAGGYCCYSLWHVEKRGKKKKDRGCRCGGEHRPSWRCPHRRWWPTTTMLCCSVAKARGCGQRNKKGREGADWNLLRRRQALTAAGGSRRHRSRSRREEEGRRMNELRVWGLAAGRVFDPPRVKGSRSM